MKRFLNIATKPFEIGRTLVSAGITQAQRITGYSSSEAYYLGNESGAELLRRMFVSEYRTTPENKSFLKEALLDIPKNIKLNQNLQEELEKVFSEHANEGPVLPPNFYALDIQSEFVSDIDIESELVAIDTESESVGVLVFNPTNINPGIGLDIGDDLKAVLEKIGMLDLNQRAKFPKIIIPLIERISTDDLGHAVTLVLETDQESPDTYQARVLDSRTDIKKALQMTGITHNYDKDIEDIIQIVQKDDFFIQIGTGKYLGIQREGTDDVSCGYYSLFVTKEILQNPKASVMENSDWLTRGERIPYQSLPEDQQESIRENIKSFLTSTDSYGQSILPSLTDQIMEVRFDILEEINSQYPNNNETIELLGLNDIITDPKICSALENDIDTYDTPDHLPVYQLECYINDQQNDCPKISEFVNLSFMPVLGNKNNTRQQSTIDCMNAVLNNPNAPELLRTLQKTIELLSNAAELSHRISTTEDTPDNDEPIQMMQESLKIAIQAVQSTIESFESEELIERFTFTLASIQAIASSLEEASSIQKPKNR